MSWSRPQFLLVYLNFGTPLHLQYMNISVEAFPQYFRYGKYFFICNLSHPYNCVGGWERFFLPNFSWRRSEHEQKPKLVFAEAEKQQNHLTSSKRKWSLIEKHKTKTSLLSCRPHNKSDVFVLRFLYRRSNLFETRQVGKVVQHRKNILNPLPD